MSSQALTLGGVTRQKMFAAELKKPFKDKPGSIMCTGHIYVD